MAYKQLSFWMYDLAAQLWYINYTRKPFVYIIVGTMFLIQLLPFYIIFAAMCHSPWAGFCALLPCVSMLLIAFYSEVMARGTWLYIHARLKEQLQSRISKVKLDFEA